MLIMSFSLLRNIKCLPITFQPQQFLCLAFKASSLHLYSRTFLCPSQAKPLPWPKHRLFFSFSASLFLTTPSPRCIMVPTQTAPNSQHICQSSCPPRLSPDIFLSTSSLHSLWPKSFPICHALLDTTLRIMSCPVLALLSFVFHLSCPLNSSGAPSVSSLCLQSSWSSCLLIEEAQ